MGEEIELTEMERKALQSAFGEAVPIGLEDRVVATLRAQGLVRSPYRRVGRWASGIAAAAAVFASGALLGKHRTSSPAAGQQFMLLLYEDEGFEQAPPSDPGAHAREYGAWARDLSDHLVAGEELGANGKLLARGGVSEQVAAAQTGAVAGYFIIAANDIDEAVRIARDCPHLKHGGRISLRPLVVAR
jgi:hypothetical protein